jgi:hypothetical protein
MEPLPNAPEPLKNETPNIIDPAGLTTFNPTYADAIPGESVLLMGYPQNEEYEGKLAASVGRILSDEEAEDVINELSEIGDEEGGISYDSDAEVIIEGHAVVGMSGGGVYNQDGQQVGVLVRTSSVVNGRQYVRARASQGKHPHSDRSRCKDIFIRRQTRCNHPSKDSHWDCRKSPNEQNLTD